MRTRIPLRRGPLLAAALAAAGLIALSGCDRFQPTADPTGAPTPAAKSGAGTPMGQANPTGTAKAAGLPDVCGLLTRAEVSALAEGKQVLQVDPDGAAAGATSRHCQWQMSGARLAVFLSPTTPAEFAQAHGTHRKVTGLGDEAVFFSGHLYVRHGRILIDVYATSSDDAAGERLAKSAAVKLLERL